MNHKTGRNSPCPCGSGQKYKKCCITSAKTGQSEEPKPNLPKPSFTSSMFSRPLTRDQQNVLSSEAKKFDVESLDFSWESIQGNLCLVIAHHNFEWSFALTPRGDVYFSSEQDQYSDAYQKCSKVQLLLLHPDLADIQHPTLQNLRLFVKNYLDGGCSPEIKHIEFKYKITKSLKYKDSTIASNIVQLFKPKKRKDFSENTCVNIAREATPNGLSYVFKNGMIVGSEKTKGTPFAPLLVSLGALIQDFWSEYWRYPSLDDDLIDLMDDFEVGIQLEGKYHEIKSTTVLEPKDYEWSYQNRILNAAIAGPTKISRVVRLNQSTYFDLNKNKLYNTEYLHLPLFLSQYEYEKLDPGILERFNFGRGEKDNNRIVRSLFSHLKSDFDVAIHCRDLKIPSARLSLDIDVNNLDRIQGHITLDEVEKVRSRSLALSEFDFLIGVSKSLRHLFDISVSKSKKYRSNELKFLRHQGIAIFMIAQVTDAVDGDVEGVSREISERVFTLFSKVCKAKVGTKILSKKFREFVVHIIESWLQRLSQPQESPYYLNHEEEFLYDGFKDISRFIPFIIKALTADLGEGLFLRQSLSKFKMNFDLEEGVFLAEYPGIGLSALAEKDLDITVGGQSLEELEESDLIAEVGLEQNQNWFDLDPKVFLKGEAISIKNALKYKDSQIMEHKGRLYRINPRSVPSVKWLDYFWNKLQMLENNEKSARKDSSIIRIPSTDVFSILALRRAGLDISGGDGWKQICQTYDLLDKASGKLESSPNFSFDKAVSHLKDFQQEGVHWLTQLYGMKLGGVLADDMGLGKTIQALVFLNYLAAIKGLKNFLVFVPASLIYNWKSEAKKFVPDLDVFIDEIPEQDRPSLTIMSYGLLNPRFEKIAAKHWDCIIFDEAQNLKNIKSKRTGLARQLKAHSKICLTGTPMENHYGEFFSLIDLVAPGALGDYGKFMKTFGGKQNSAEDIEFLRLKSSPLVLRRAKQTILDKLPEKSETQMLLPFEKKQKKIYKDTALSWNQKLRSVVAEKGENKSQLEMLTALLRLRQICSSPAIVNELKYEKIAPKIGIASEAIADLVSKGESVLVFTSFRKTLDLIQEHLTSRGCFSLQIAGNTPKRKREGILREFCESEASIALLMTQKVGGVGLNLVKARYVFHIEPWWNPAVENQATDRAHRMGQTREVQVFRYIMESSVEEKIQQLKNKKAKLFDDLFKEENDQPSQRVYGKSKLSQTDFEYLIST